MEKQEAGGTSREQGRDGSCAAHLAAASQAKQVALTVRLLSTQNTRRGPPSALQTRGGRWDRHSGADHAAGMLGSRPGRAPRLGGGWKVQARWATSARRETHRKPLRNASEPDSGQERTYFGHAPTDIRHHPPSILSNSQSRNVNNKSACKSTLFIEIQTGRA